MNVCSPNFDYMLKYISVCTDTEHQGNRYPAASASPPETLTQQLYTPGTVTILQGVDIWINTQIFCETTLR